jgi:hypothetical protein
MASPSVRNDVNNGGHHEKEKSITQSFDHELTHNKKGETNHENEKFI